MPPECCQVGPVRYCTARCTAQCTAQCSAH
jgi:hypothetical protein